MDNAYEKELRLIRASKAGDRSATEKIVAKYEPLVRNIAFGETRIDTEDLWQELRLSLLEGLQEFREEKGIYFGCFIRKKLKWKKMVRHPGMQKTGRPGNLLLRAGHGHGK